ncbi:MAG: hypothetical protein MZV70_22425 [Desulfobacterales bacterium]|nr:hypothetical protein [Desulfobacterales bacterium]
MARQDPAGIPRPPGLQVLREAQLPFPLRGPLPGPPPAAQERGGTHDLAPPVPGRSGGSTGLPGGSGSYPSRATPTDPLRVPVQVRHPEVQGGGTHPYLRGSPGGGETGARRPGGGLRGRAPPAFGQGQEETVRSLYEAEDAVLPCLFNSGCATGKKGFTGLEIEGGSISLVYWADSRVARPYVEQEALEITPLEGTPWTRYVLKRDKLDYVTARIELLRKR